MKSGLRAAAAALGISDVALLKAKKTGRIKTEPDGTYDVEACRVALAANSHPVQSRVARMQKRGPRVDSKAAPDDGSIAEAARQLEWEKLREKRLKVDREEARLVPLHEVNAFVAGMVIKARDEFLRIGREEAGALAQISDPVKCEEIVTARVVEALEKLTEYRPAA